MTSQLSLLDYPLRAGAKEETTSRDNAERIEASGRAQSLREQVRTWFASGRTGTADEVATALGEHFLAIRPRLTELRATGAIEPTGERRKGTGGGTAHVWRRTTPPQP